MRSLDPPPPVRRAVALLAAAAVLASAGMGRAGTVRDLCRPHVLADDVVASADQRQAAGAKVVPPSLIDPVNGFAWPDTPMGVTRTLDGTGYLFFGSDGGCHARCASVTQRDGSITRTVGTLDDPLGHDAPQESLLQSPALQPPVDYVGGGPVLRIPPGLPGAGDLVLVYHAEDPTYVYPYRYPDPLKDQKSFYSRLGLAASADDGQSWTDLGFVIRANKPYEPNGAGYEIGDGDLVVDPTGTYFLLYFPDRIEHGPVDTFLSVARAPIADVVDAAFARGPAPHFTKYYDGSWDQPGIGGLSSTLLPQPYPSFAGSPSVAWSDDIKRYVAVFDDTQNISYAESPDGLLWSDPVLLKGTNSVNASALYAVLVGMGDDPRRLGRRYHVYFTYYPNPANPKIRRAGWQGAEVRRLTVDCAPP